MTQVLQGTPRDQGYRMPAEWTLHEATWIAWPHNADDWPGKFQAIPWAYADIVRHLSRVDEVHILVDNEAAGKRATGILRRAGATLARVHFHAWPTDRVWTRDSGPIFVKKDDSLAVTNWIFNGWAKYENHKLDDQIPHHVAQDLNLPEWTPTFGDRRVVLEGGSIDTNGNGILLTTEECLLSDVQQRNPGLTRHDLERLFHDYLGIDYVLWLNRGIAGDDTHGHIDDIARFVTPDDVVLTIETDPSDANYEPLQENLERLRIRKDIRVTTLLMPEPVFFAGQRLPASYANFYIANNLVLAPTFGDKNDAAALITLEGLFPDRAVVGIPCRDLVVGLGTLHCMTQQQPA
jgi:agmatine deiminase